MTQKASEMKHYNSEGPSHTRPGITFNRDMIYRTGTGVYDIVVNRICIGYVKNETRKGLGKPGDLFSVTCTFTFSGEQQPFDGRRFIRPRDAANEAMRLFFARLDHRDS